MCLRNLFRRRARTALCVAGVALTVMSMVAIGATITSYTSAIREMNTFFAGNILVVSKNQIVIQALPVAGGNLRQEIEKDVKSISGVRATVPLLFLFSMELRSTIEMVPMNITVGVPHGNWTMLTDSAPLRTGGNYPSKNASDEILVGSCLADLCGIAVNSTIDIGNHTLTVRGVLDTRSAILGRMIIMSLETAQEIYHYPMTVSMIVAEPEEDVDVEEVADQIESELNNPVERIKALTSEERNNLIDPLLDEVDMWNLGISGVLFVTGVTIVTLVVMINVSERRRDFATLDALGASFTSKVLIVLTEIGFIGLLGSLIGVFLGAVAAVTIISVYTNIPIHMLFPDIFTIVSPLLLAKTVACMVTASCVAGLIPAIAAARTSIADVLRGEY
ncbi:MAG: ABC transporter permease [Candidatus Bathyarchaeota archaeon]|nr:ABC transporter permease [Candidatus Bathyarchaeota archaeon]